MGRMSGDKITVDTANILKRTVYEKRGTCYKALRFVLYSGGCDMEGSKWGGMA